MSIIVASTLTIITSRDAHAQRWIITSQTSNTVTGYNQVTGASAGAAVGIYGGRAAGFVNPYTGAHAGVVVGPAGAGRAGFANPTTGRRAGVAWIPGVGFVAGAGGPNGAGYVAYSPATGGFRYGGVNKTNGQAEGGVGNVNSQSLVQWKNY